MNYDDFPPRREGGAATVPSSAVTAGKDRHHHPMISPDNFPPISPLARELMAIADEGYVTQRILNVADFLGWQELPDGGKVQLWTLTKPIKGHPAGSTLVRSTLLRALGISACVVEPCADFGAVESPKGTL